MDNQPYAVIDIGSNTVHLLVGASDGQGVTPLVDESTSLYLGQAVEATGTLGAAQTEALLHTVSRMVRAGLESGAARVDILATHALRIATDSPAALDAIRAATGQTVEVISSQQEALLGFMGAVASVPGSGAALVIEIGGGSMQVILGEDTPVGEAAWPLGSGRVTRRFFTGDPPGPAEQARLRAYLARVIPPTLPAGPPPTRAIGVGGSLRRLITLLDVPPGSPLPADWVEQATDLLCHTPAAQLAARFLVAPERIRLLLATVYIADEVLRGYDRPPFAVAAYGIREGAILMLARRDHAGPKRGTP
jgi:exopolyphosphatase/guanosine-5'-triphosphate,3'-diphosphate pyrophosphatase